MNATEGLQYSEINALFNHHHRGFLLHSSSKWGKNARDLQSNIKQRKGVLETHSSKWDFSIESHPSELREPHKREIRKSIRVRGVGGHQKNNGLWINWARLIKLRDWSSKNIPYMDLHIYIISFSLLFLWDSCLCELEGIWFLYLLSRLFFLLLGFLGQSLCDGFDFILYFILSSLVVIL